MIHIKLSMPKFCLLLWYFQVSFKQFYKNNRTAIGKFEKEFALHKSKKKLAKLK